MGRKEPHPLVILKEYPNGLTTVDVSRWSLIWPQYEELSVSIN
jgi:hypothetical protein